MEATSGAPEQARFGQSAGETSDVGVRTVAEQRCYNRVVTAPEVAAIQRDDEKMYAVATIRAGREIGARTAGKRP